MPRDRRCPDHESRWELWYQDYFDRDSASKETEGTDIVEGLAIMWRKLAVEGVFDDGQPTFTWFSIRWGDGSVAESAHVHRDPSMNPGLKNIHLWRSQELFDEIAAAHLRLLEQSSRWEEDAINAADESKPILELAEKSEDVRAFREALAKL